MIEPIEEMEELVAVLNQEVFDHFEDRGMIAKNYFKLVSNGAAMNIEFMDQNIWDSEDDKRQLSGYPDRVSNDEDEEILESVENFVRRTVAERIKVLSTLEMV